MLKIFTIAHYEYKMQWTRIATWGVLLAGMAVALLDNFPSAQNLARLEFLSRADYFIARIMGLDGLFLMFGAVFLLSNRITIDQKTGMSPLIMASPITKAQYLCGKLLGGFLLAYPLLALLLALNTTLYFLAAPFKPELISCLVPLVKTLVVCGLPVSIFISFTSICLPAIMDVRLFYLLAAILFIVNAATVGTAGPMPFYMITSGDLLKLIWQHPQWPFVNAGSMEANLCFLVGCGGLGCFGLLFNRHFWRKP